MGKSFEKNHRWMSSECHLNVIWNQCWNLVKTVHCFLYRTREINAVSFHSFVLFNLYLDQYWHRFIDFHCFDPNTFLFFVLFSHIVFFSHFCSLSRWLSWLCLVWCVLVLLITLIWSILIDIDFFFISNHPNCCVLLIYALYFIMFQSIGIIHIDLFLLL